jgi:hypothetical protein
MRVRSSEDWQLTGQQDGCFAQIIGVVDGLFCPHIQHKAGHKSQEYQQDQPEIAREQQQLALDSQHGRSALCYLLYGPGGNMGGHFV